MAYQFYQNAKMVQSQVGQSEDAVNQAMQSSIEEYKQNFAQANYTYAVDLAQEQTGKAFEKLTGVGELLGGIPAAFNSLKKGATSARNIVSKIKGEPTADIQPGLTDDTSKAVSDGLSSVSERLSDGISSVSERLSDGLSSVSQRLSDGISSAFSNLSFIKDQPIGEASTMTFSTESQVGEGGKVFDNPLFGEDLGDSRFADQITTQPRQQFGTADYTGTQASSVPTPVLPIEETTTPTITADASSDVLDKTTSDLITSSVQETAGTVEKTASKSIWDEIGDTIADVGLGAVDVLDPLADIAEAGVAVAGITLGAKAIEGSEKSPDLAPPQMQRESLLQTSSISAIPQPGV